MISQYNGYITLLLLYYISKKIILYLSLTSLVSLPFARGYLLTPVIAATTNIGTPFSAQTLQTSPHDFITIQ